MEFFLCDRIQHAKNVTYKDQAAYYYKSAFGFQSFAYKGLETGNKEYRIEAVSLDEGSIVRWNPEVDRERKVAIYDLLEENYFSPVSKLPGPFDLLLQIEDNRLVFHIKSIYQSDAQTRVLLPMSPEIMPSR